MAALEASEQEFRTLAEAVPQIVWATRPDGWNIFFNQQWMDYTGLTLEESTGHGWNKPFHPDDQQRAWNAWQAATTKLATYSLECRLRRADGVYRWWLIRGEPLKDASGNIVKWFGTCTDIHDLKLAEKALQQSEQRVRLATEAAGVAVWEWDIKVNTVKWDEQMFRMYGLPPTPEGRVVYQDWSSRVLPEDLVEQEEKLKRTVAACGRSQREFRITRTSDKAVRFIQSAEMVVAGADGQPERMVGINLDITKRKQAEVKLAEQAVELQRSNLELEQFAYVASHDLQEPLRLVSAYTELLLQRYRSRLDLEADPLVNFITEGVTRMQRLIQDLLAYSRVSSRNKPLALAPSQKALDMALQDLAMAIHEQHALVTHDVLPELVCDGKQLVQLFQNLIGNALKFRRPEEPPLVHVGARRTGDGNAWLFSVRDNGIGIEMEFYERIFVIFQRLHSRKKYSGTGIGLAICKRIVEHHGGRIWVESQKDLGTTFLFTISTKPHP